MRLLLASLPPLQLPLLLLPTAAADCCRSVCFCSYNHSCRLQATMLILPLLMALPPTRLPSAGGLDRRSAARTWRLPLLAAKPARSPPSGWSAAAQACYLQGQEGTSGRHASTQAGETAGKSAAGSRERRQQRRQQREGCSVAPPGRCGICHPVHSSPCPIPCVLKPLKALREVIVAAMPAVRV